MQRLVLDGERGWLRAGSLTLAELMKLSDGWWVLTVSARATGPFGTVEDALLALGAPSAEVENVAGRARRPSPPSADSREWAEEKERILGSEGELGEREAPAAPRRTVQMPQRKRT